MEISFILIENNQNPQIILSTESFNIIYSNKIISCDNNNIEIVYSVDDKQNYKKFNIIFKKIKDTSEKINIGKDFEGMIVMLKINDEIYPLLRNYLLDSFSKDKSLIIIRNNNFKLEYRKIDLYQEKIFTYDRVLYYDGQYIIPNITTNNIIDINIEFNEKCNYLSVRLKKQKYDKEDVCEMRIDGDEVIIEGKDNIINTSTESNLNEV